MAPINQFFYRTSKSIGLTESVPVYEDIEAFDKPSGNMRVCVYSPDGKYFAYASAEDVKVVDAESGATRQVIPAANVYEIGFSPRSTYMTTWERQVKAEEGQAAHQNFKVWNVASAELVTAFSQKSQTLGALQFTFDEKYCARLVTNELHLFESAKVGAAPMSRIRAEGASTFSISGGQNYHIAIFVPERKGKPGVLQVYKVLNAALPIVTKNFFKAERVVLKWNKLGTSLLIWTQTEVDQTGKSYYGESTLYLTGITTNFDCRISLDKEGPIYDVAWSPDSREFGVVYGYMPATTTIFNTRGDVVRHLPSGPRNTILYSPHGRFVLLAGFGNLQGAVDIYDRSKTFEKVTSIDASNASLCEWCPDGRHLLTATTSPRLRVDNGVRIWHVTGKLIYAREMHELFAAAWRPLPVESFPIRTVISPAPAPHDSAASLTQKAPVKAAGAYRPPHQRGAGSAFKKTDEGGLASLEANLAAGVHRSARTKAVPGAAPAEPAPVEEPLSKAALKNKKKREAKKARDTAEAEPEPEQTPEPAAESAPLTVGGTVVPTGVIAPADEKKFRGLMKKLRAIEDLKARQGRGDKLEETQLTKITTEPAIRSDLAALGWRG
ncbi:eukaryotic translation initiation factor eIF2A-domain-containing protein [Dipodascopsis tothii]|uniref:eukaryotic translation initiation factor eIF2A-domain-containing protein n=1 Tax=Dipodascopsis tothii TaxID=44089 RepID=UPI0034CE2EBC